jgi:hypothetical protein
VKRFIIEVLIAIAIGAGLGVGVWALASAYSGWADHVALPPALLGVH